MIDIHKAFQTIIKELIALDAHPIDKHPGKPPSLPGSIATGRGDSIPVNEAIERQILDVADWMRQQRPSVRATHSLREWRAAVRAAFGPALLQIDYSGPLDKNAQELKRLIEEGIDKNAPASGTHIRSMGCSLFSCPLEAPFSVGPVVFEPKTAWLDRALETAQISKISHHRLTRAFAGHPLKSGRTSKEAMQEESILDVLGKAQMVCTVTTEGLAPEAAQERSIIAARLAQASIALRWTTPSRVLGSFRLSVDHGPRVIQTIPFTPGQWMIGGRRWAGIPHGPEMSTTDWNARTHDARDFFNVAGKMVACWTSTTANSRASPVLRCLSQALFFFWEGCRDENDLMSIVEFTAALETLAQGKSGPILKLVKARLGVNNNDKFAGDRTLKQVINLIYSKARSRTLHGKNKDILHDWSDARAIAESMTRYCIMSCVDWVAKNPTASDPKSLRT